VSSGITHQDIEAILAASAVDEPAEHFDPCRHPGTGNRAEEHTGEIQ
jgi:hypothetical protein